MIFNREIASQTAKLLLQINAIKLNCTHPFTWASGLKSPIYCNNRLILSHLYTRTYITSVLADLIHNRYAQEKMLIAGVSTGAIGIASLVANKLNYPYINIYPSKKIKLYIEIPKPVLVIEDLISTGKSSLKAIDSLDPYKSEIKGVLGLFTYGFETAYDRFKEHDLSLTTLCDYQQLIKEAQLAGMIKQEEYHILKSWRKYPYQWSKKSNL